MIIKKIKSVLILTFFSFVAGSCYAGPAASISDLEWMTGSWVAQLGPNGTLEENWIKAENGSIAAMVRMTNDGSISMIEVLVIEESEGSLVLSVQQWDAGFTPRTADAQKMELVEISENRVAFKAVTEGSMNALAYSRPTPTTFSIELETPDGVPVQITLNAR